MKQYKLPLKSTKCPHCGKYSKVGKSKCKYCEQQFELPLNNTERRIDAIKHGN